jgi:hypothetical protein
MKLPAPPPTTIWQDMAEFQKFAEETHARMTDPTQKKALGEMLQQLREARAKAEDVVPKLVTDMKNQAEAQKAEVAKAQAEIARLQAELEAKKAEAERMAQDLQAAKPPVETPVDKNKARQLTDELLGRFARPAQPAAAVEDLGSVAEAWVEPNQDVAHHDEEPKPTPPPPAKKAAAPAVKKKNPQDKDAPKSGDDIWEGLSRLED